MKKTLSIVAVVAFGAFALTSCQANTTGNVICSPFSHMWSYSWGFENNDPGEHTLHIDASSYTPDLGPTGINGMDVAWSPSGHSGLGWSKDTVETSLTITVVFHALPAFPQEAVQRTVTVPDGATCA